MEAVQNFSLFVTLSIISGIFFGAFFIFVDTLNWKDDTRLATAFLWASWVSAPVFIAYYAFFSDQNGKLTLTPLGMMIAAFIASASVMKSIVSQRQIEHEKVKREKEASDKKARIDKFKWEQQELRHSDEVTRQNVMAHERERFERDLEKQRVAHNLKLEEKRERREMFDRRMALYDNVRTLMIKIIQHVDFEIIDIFKYLEIERIKLIYPHDEAFFKLLKELEDQAIDYVACWEQIRTIDSIIQKDDEKMSSSSKVPTNIESAIGSVIRKEERDKQIDKMSTHSRWVIENKNNIDQAFISSLQLELN